MQQSYIAERTTKNGLRLISLLIFVFVVAALLVAAPRKALAGNFTVSVTADAPDAAPGDGSCDDGAGNCTLRAAIMESNANGDATNIVTVKPGIYRLTETGSEGFYSPNDAIGDLDIFKSITINGETGNPADVTIDANGLGKVLSFNPTWPGTPSFDASIYGLTLTGGTVKEDDNMGTGIDWAADPGSSATLTVDNCIIEGNHGTGSAMGGGLFLYGGKVNITHTRISGNNVDYQGGGIWVGNGTNLTVTDSLLLNNTAASGGGLLADSGDTTIDSSTIIGNVATFAGGGIDAGTTATVTLRVQNTTLASNTATSKGGAIMVNAGANVTVSNATITANTAGATGGILKEGGTLEVNNSIVTGNTGGNGAFSGSGNQSTVTGLGLLTTFKDALGHGWQRGYPLLAGSSAIDAGDNTKVVGGTDQRGATRKLDSADVGEVATVDVGAYERVADMEDITNQTILIGGTRTVSFRTGSGTVTATATSSNAAVVPNDAGHLSISGAGSSRTLSITPTGPGATTVTVTLTASGAEPTYMDAGTDTVTDTFVLTVAGTPDLTITKSHTGNFPQGGTGSYTLTVHNGGDSATTAPVTVTDTAPAGLTVTGMSGIGWTCTGTSCTRSDALAAGGNYPAITVSVAVATDATSSLTNKATVSGGGETDTTNDEDPDDTTVLQNTSTTVSAVSGQYGGTVTLTATVTTGLAGSVQFSVPGAGTIATAAVDPGTGVATTAPITINFSATEHALTATFVPTNALYLSSSDTKTFTVAKAPLTVTADSCTRTYGASALNCTATYSGFVLGQDKSVLGGSLAFATTATASSNVGDYSLTPQGVTSPNYAVTFVDGTLTIEAAPLKVTADNKSRFYGSANPALTVSYDGFVPGQDESVLSGTLALATTATASSVPDGYAITPSGWTSTNYAITFVAGTLTITPAPLTVTADNQTKTYGDPNPTLTARYSGFVLGQDAGVLGGTLSVTTPADQSSGATFYDIVPVGVTSSNYAITFVKGTLTVNKAALTVTADNSSKVYGSANPAFTASYSGFVLGQHEGVLGGTLSFATSAVSGSAVGSYDVTPAGLGSPNYTITFAKGTLTVTPAPLTVTADSCTRTYGASALNCTATYSGFVLGQDKSVLGGSMAFVTTATASSDVGDYSLTPQGLTSTNYALTFVDGTLTIAAAPLTITADDFARSYGSEDAEFLATYSGFVLGQDENVLSGTLSLTTTATKSSNAGTYPITVAGQTSTNYAITFVNGTLSITPASLTVTADNQAKTYGDPNPTLTARYSGFVLGQDAGVLSGTLAVTTPADQSSGATSYEIVPAGVTSSNYAITFVKGTLTVNKAALTVTADNSSKVYGSANPPFTASYSGFVLGQHEDILGGTLSFTTSAVSGSGVGSYDVTPAGLGSPNYAITFAKGTLTVTPAALTVTAEDFSRAYGSNDAEYLATYSGFVLGQGDSVLGGTLSYTTTATASSDVGDYSLTPQGLTSTNYALTFVAGKLTVKAASLKVTADDKSRLYGSANPTLTARYDGFVLGQDESVLSGTLAVTTTATASNNAGPYPITVTGQTSTNYAITFVNGTLTITPAPLTVTADNQTKTYGDPNPTLTARYSGFVLGQDAGVLSGTLSVTTPADQSSGATFYDIVPAGVTSSNYAITFVKGTLTVNKAALTVTADNSSKVYGSANPAFTASYSGFVLGQHEGVLGGTLSFATSAVSGSAVGSYDVTPAGLGSPNYAITFAKGTLTVTPAPLTVTAEDFSRAYGSNDAEYLATYSGFVLGQGDSVLGGTLSYTTTATTSSGVGDYSLTPQGLTSTNYALTFVAGKLTVKAASLKVTADDKSRLYGSANPTLTARYDGFVLGQDESVLSGTLAVTTTATASNNAGAYSITATGLTATNYAITFVNGTLTITPAPLTVTADDQTKTYGDANPTLTAHYSGFVLGQDAGVLSGTLAVTTPADQSSGATSYDIVPAGVTSSNYAITFVKGTLTVNKAALTVTADNSSKVYGSANPAFTASYSGFVLGQHESVLGGTLSFTTSAVPGSAVGSYDVTPAGLDSPNYAITFAKGTLTVTPAPLTVTADNSSKLYGSANPAFTASYSGFVLGQDESVLSGTLSYTTTATTSSDVGDYSLTPQGLTSANYALTFAAGKLTVKAASLKVTANDQNRLYGSANPTLTARYDGFVPGQDESVLSGTLAVTTAATESSNAGTYGITASGLTATNYAVTFVPGTLTINPAPLTVTGDNQTRTYGDSNPTFTVRYSGFVLGQNEGALGGTLTFTTSAVLGSDVGTYDVTPAGLTSTNYAITFAKGTLAVTKAPLTVTADDQTRTYGATEPVFTASYSGFVLGETAVSLGWTPTFTTTANASSIVGDYRITPDGPVLDNYDLTFTNGKLTVTKAPLTVKADDKSKVYRTPNPTFTASYTGFVLGENASVLGGTLAFATTADEHSSIGTYPVTPSGLTSGNYQITFDPGTLTVTKALLTVKADDKTKVYGQDNPALTVTYTGFAPGDDEGVLTGTLVLTTTATQSSGAGTYPIHVTGLTAAGYEITFVDGTLTATRAPLTITALGGSMAYGETPPAYAASYSGFVLGQNESVLTGTLAIYSEVDSGSQPGTYRVQAAGLSSPNYEITYVDGSLRVTARSLTIAAPNASRPYGAANPAFSGNVAGLLADDGITVTYETTATTTSPPGQYPITAKLNDPLNRLGRYRVQNTAGSLTITATNVTVTVGNGTRPYGEANPAFTTTATGLPSGLSLDLAISTEAGLSSPVGTYPVRAALKNSLPGVVISVENGTLTVTGAPLTVTPRSITRNFGASSPALSGTVTGLKNGDAITAAYSTAATTTSPPGTYPITATLSDPAGKLGNYQVTIQQGTLTIRGCDAFDLTKDEAGQAEAYLHCSLSDDAKAEVLAAVTDTPANDASVSEATTIQVQEAIAKAQAETGTAPRVVLTPNPDSAVQGAVIDRAAMGQLAQTGGEVALSTGLGTLVMPATVLQAMAGEPDSGALVILFEEVKGADVQTDQLRPASPVVEITVTTRRADGSVERHEQFDTNLTLTLPITDGNADPELAGLYRFILDASGKITGIEYVGGEVGADGHTISVPRDHLSEYGVLVYDHEFADVPADHWAYRAVKVMTARHVVNGVSETEFDPGRAVTRAEFAAMVARAFGVKIPSAATRTFPDVPADKWYAATMSAVVEAGLFTPEEGGGLRPDVPITRQEMAVVIERAMTTLYARATLPTPDPDQVLAPFQDQSELAAANRDAIARLVAAGLLKGRATDTLAPDGTTTRAEAVTLIKRLLDWGKAQQ